MEYALRLMDYQNITKQPHSWGRYPKVKHSQVQSIYWRNELPDIAQLEETALPFAYGLSYGDSGLNEGGISLDVSHLQRFVSLDEKTGLLRCDAGNTLAQRPEVFEPRCWVSLVSPGTMSL